MQSLGERLHYVRKQKGYSQEGLAKKIGVSRGVIYNIEQNKNDPQEIVVNALCDVLNVSKEWLVSGNGEIFNYSSSKNQILKELYDLAQDLSIEEQLYLLDVAKLLKKHFNKE